MRLVERYEKHEYSEKSNEKNVWTLIRAWGSRWVSCRKWMLHKPISVSTFKSTLFHLTGLVERLGHATSWFNHCINPKTRHENVYFINEGLG